MLTQDLATQKILISKRDCANALSLSLRTIENLIARRKLTIRRVGSRTLILVSSMEAFAQHDHDSPSAPKSADSTETQIAATAA